MKGKWYGVYDIRDYEQCVGVFESTEELCAFFGGITRDRVWHAIYRNGPLTFGSKRYHVEVFKYATEKEVRRKLKQRFGAKMYKITPEGIFTRKEGVVGWRFFASDFEEVAQLCA